MVVPHIYKVFFQKEWFHLKSVEVVFHFNLEKNIEKVFHSDWEQKFYKSSFAVDILMLGLRENTKLRANSVLPSWDWAWQLQPGLVLLYGSDKELYTLLIKSFLMNVREVYIGTCQTKSLKCGRTDQTREIAERVCILSYFQTAYKSLEKRAQGLNFISCTRAIHLRDGLSLNKIVYILQNLVSIYLFIYYQTVCIAIQYNTI